ncbi:hypothetical protein D9M69_728890 [compost metagenome]
MQAQIGIAVAGVGHQARIRHDDRIGAQALGGVHRGAPLLRPARLHEGVDGEQHLALAAVRQLHAGADIGFGEI